MDKWLLKGTAHKGHLVPQNPCKITVLYKLHMYGCLHHQGFTCMLAKLGLIWIGIWVILFMPPRGEIIHTK